MDIKDIKTDCEYWELEAKNECYMFKPFDCSTCKKCPQKRQINVGYIGPTGVGKGLLVKVLVEVLSNQEPFNISIAKKQDK